MHYYQRPLMDTVFFPPANSCCSLLLHLNKKKMHDDYKRPQWSQNPSQKKRKQDGVFREHFVLKEWDCGGNMLSGGRWGGWTERRGERVNLADNNTEVEKDRAEAGRRQREMRLPVINYAFLQRKQGQWISLIKSREQRVRQSCNVV